MTQILVSLTPPDAATYAGLRAMVGWGDVSLPVAQAALDGALFAATARANSTIVGMGRVIGDGALNYYIQDVIVRESHRGHGIADEIIACLMGEIRQHAAPGAVVGLMAARGVEPLYERHGFVSRPGGIYGHGMMQSV